MNTKSIFMSKTFWGIALTALAPLAPKLGLHVTADSTAAVASEMVTLVGAALAIYGRVKADSKVSLTGK